MPPAYPTAFSFMFPFCFHIYGNGMCSSYSANMPPAAASAALDLGLHYHVFCNDAEPSRVFLQPGDSGTILPKMAEMVSVSSFQFFSHWNFWVHVDPFKCIYDRIHQDDSVQLREV